LEDDTTSKKKKEKRTRDREGIGMIHGGGAV
jgi:hypothetical protein